MTVHTAVAPAFTVTFPVGVPLPMVGVTWTDCSSCTWSRIRARPTTWSA
jgi:hypothetical protein